MVEIEEISLTYPKGKKALDQVSFSLAPGSFTSLLGPSGCGKTTMLKVLAGFLTPQHGRILIDGRDITSLPAQKRGTAMVFQNYALWPHMTAFDNIAYGLRLKKLPKAEIEDRVSRMLQIVEIDPDIVKTRHPSELSGGQQQRVALARALVVEPSILLMDEPLSSLDAKVRQHLRVEIREVQQRLGVTAIYVTHDQEEAMSMSDQIVLMQDGRIVQTGSPQTVYNRPLNSFAAEFLGNSNVLYGRVEQDGLYLGNQRLADRGGLAEGDVKIVIRSEQFSFGPQNGDIALRCRFVRTMYSGSYYRHILEAEGQSVFVDTQSEAPLKEDVVLYVPLRSVYTYPA